METSDDPVGGFDTSKYKFNEGELIKELTEYINSTYSEHYSKNKFQSTEFIIDCGHGEGFALGNVLKYVQRYGKKDGRNRKDLLKVLHYGIIALANHDHELEKTKDHHKSKWRQKSLLENMINGSSIDDATPEEWNAVSKKILKKKSVKGESE